MVYLPASTCFFKVNVGKYAIHGSYGVYLANVANLAKKEFKSTLDQEGVSSLMFCLLEGAHVKILIWYCRIATPKG